MSNVRRILRCMLCILLTVSILVGILPTKHPVKINAENTESTEEIPTQNLTEEQPPATVVGEIIEKRERFAKHFRMSDGTQVAAVYPEAVHYNANGQWKEIDNSLVSTIDSKGSAILKSAANNYTASFPVKSSSDDLVSLELDGRTISWRLESALESNVTDITDRTGADTTSELTSDIASGFYAKNTKSYIRYPEILPGVDLDYILKSEQIKENIVLKQKGAANSFTFLYDFGDLEPVLEPDNSVSFIDTKTGAGTELSLTAPYMYDADYEYSADIKVSIEKSDNKYRVTLTADNTWLEEKDRVYPVVIDPTLSTKTKVSTIRDGYASGNDPNSYWYNTIEFLRIGDQNSSGFDCITYIRFSEMPELSTGDNIVDAKLTLIPMHRYTNNSSHTMVNSFNPKPMIYAYKVTSNWDTTNPPQLTYNRQPNAESIVLDYEIVDGSAQDVNTRSYNWNITRAVGEWYRDGNDYGIKLKMSAQLPTSTWFAHFVSSDYTHSAPNDRPSIMITYRNTSGLEDYYTYHEQSAGRAGTGYVNDYTGNLVLAHMDASTPGTRMPVCVSHIYGNDKRVSDNYSNIYPKYGNGWSLDCIERITATDIADYPDYPYKYTDGDGTDHYFYHAAGDASNIYTDEDGLGLKLEAYSSIQQNLYWYKITSKSGIEKRFDKQVGNNGVLRKVTDPNGNSIVYNYETVGSYKRLSQITDAAGHSISFAYNSNHCLSGITDPAGRTTTFTYSDGFDLIKITYPDGRSSYYSYYGASYGNQLRSMLNYDGYSITYEYYNNRLPYRVSHVTEKNGSSNEGGRFRVSYAHNTTTFTDLRKAGRVYTYQFNNWGQTVGIIDKNGNAVSGRYNNGSKLATNHKLSEHGRINRPVVNLLSNHSFENGLSGWTAYGTGSATTTDSQKYMGNNSLYVTNSDPADNACTYAYTDEMSTLGEGVYTISAYVKSVNVENEGFTSGFGAGIDIRVTNNGQNSWYVSELLRGTSDTAIDDGWRRVYVTFTLGPGDSLSRVYFGIFNATGTAYIDCVQLEKGDSMNSYNLIENSSFEKNTGLHSTPLMWEAAGTQAQDGVSNLNVVDGSFSYRLTGTPTTSSRIYQVVKTKGQEGDTYSLSAWVTADSVDYKNVYSFCMIIKTEYSDSTVDFKTYNFNKAVKTKQMVTGHFVVDDGNPATNKAYDRLKIFFGYYNNVNCAYLDNVQLFKDTQQSYRYDSNGNLVSTADLAKKDTTFSYSDNNMTKLTNPSGSSYEYAYDYSKKRIELARSSEGVKYSFYYDSYGNPVWSDAKNDSYGESIVPGTKYYIRAKCSAKYLTVYNGATANGSDVKQLSMNRNNEQQWLVEEAGDGYYRLKPAHAPDKSLYVANNANNTQMEIYTTANTDNQKFKLIPTGEGTYRILTKISADSKAVFVNGSGTGENVNVVQYTFYSYEGQRFIFEPVSKITSTRNWDSPGVNKTFYIRARHSGKYLDSMATDNGSYMIQCYFHGGSNQQFKLIDCSGEYYKIAPVNGNGKVLQIESGTSKLVLSPKKTANDDDQLFSFNRTGTNSTYKIVSKLNSSLSAEVSGASYADYTDILMTTGTSGAHREFILEEVSLMIHTSASYNQDNGNYMTSLTDARGKTSNFSYNTSKGTLTYTRAPGETSANQTNYTYDANTDALTSVSKTDGTRTITNSYAYIKDRLDRITHNGFDYRFAYDSFGNPTTVKVGVGSNLQTLVTNTYKQYNGLLDTVTYGNGNTVSYIYDADYDYVTGIKYGGSQKFAYTYNNQGNLFKAQDYINNQTIHYEYDFADRLTRVKNTNGLELSFQYDAKNRPESYTSILNGEALKTKYTYGDPSVSGSQKAGMIYGIRINNNSIVTYSYDSLARRTTRSNAWGAGTFFSTYSYLPGSGANTTTTLLGSVTNQGYNFPSQKFSYTYDEKGNILTIKENDVLKVSYEYDNLNQLKRENNLYINKTVTYSYDAGGNITEKKEYAYTTGTLGTPTDTIPYLYEDANWKDKLTSYDGAPITYDAIGNPTSIGSSWSLSWQNGRQLAGMTKNGTACTYKYNDSGIRTQKTVAGVTTKYYLNGGRVEAETDGTNTLRYFYDEAGDVIGFKITNPTYPTGKDFYYIRNGQNDIIGIADSTGNLVVSYVYDSWGKLISTTGTLATTIGVINPYRYRGYRYDNETGLYYLQSRYYNPESGRFLNADNQVRTGGDLTGMNLFAYCGNCPVNRSDPTGHAFMFLTAAIGAVAGAIVGGVVAAATGKNVLAGVLVGAAAGGIIGLTCGAAAGVMLAGSATASTAAVVSGAGMLAMAVSTGGAGAGVALVVDNISRAINNVGTVLYSGGEQARQAATTFANNTGGTTIDTTVIGQVADAATKAPGADFETVWSQASAAFCNQASGVVNAFISNSAYRGEDSIFWSVEMRTLLNNSRVTEIIIHIFE